MQCHPEDRHSCTSQVGVLRQLGNGLRYWKIAENCGGLGEKLQSPAANGKFLTRDGLDSGRVFEDVRNSFSNETADKGLQEAKAIAQRARGQIIQLTP